MPNNTSGELTKTLYPLVEPYWDKQPKEQVRYYQLFTQFCSLGENRSLSAMSKMVGTTGLANLTRLSKEWGWFFRAKHLDAHHAKIEAAHNHEEIIKARRKTAVFARQYKLKAAKALRKLDPAELDIKNLMQSYKIAHDLEMEAMGAPNVQKVEHSGPGGAPLNPVSINISELTVGAGVHGVEDAQLTDGVIDVTPQDGDEDETD